MRDPLIERMTNHPILQRDVVIALTEQIAAENLINPQVKTEAKEKLFCHFLRRVADLANLFYIKRVHFFGKFCSFDDLFSESSIALWKTINKIGLEGGYDPNGAPFIIYVSRFICLRLKTYLAKKEARGLFSPSLEMEIDGQKTKTFPLDQDDSDLSYEADTLENLSKAEIAGIIKSEKTKCGLTKREVQIIDQKYSADRSLRDMAIESGVSNTAFNQSHERALNKIGHALIKKYPKTFSHAN